MGAALRLADNENVSSQDFNYAKPVNLAGFKVLSIYHAILSNGIDRNVYYSLVVQSKLTYRDGEMCYLLKERAESHFSFSVHIEHSIHMLMQKCILPLKVYMFPEQKDQT